MAKVFLLGQELGSGSFGTVYAAKSQLPPCEDVVAVKVAPLCEYEEDEDRRVDTNNPCAGTVRELIVLQSLPPHPNLVRLLGADWSDSHVYLSMPLYQVNAYHSCHFMNASDVVWIGKSIARALLHMHRHGWLHRDVKPENILLAPNECVLADFSLCQSSCFRLEKDGRTSNSSFQTLSNCTTHICTLWTRPTELVQDGLMSIQFRPSYGDEVDVFSLGTTLYTMLCGFYTFGRLPESASLSLSREQRYLHDFFTIYGSSPEIESAYPYVKSVAHIDPSTRLDRFMRLIHATRAEEDAANSPSAQPSSITVDKDLLTFLISMMNPIPKMRPSMSQVVATFDKWSSDQSDSFRALLEMLRAKQLSKFKTFTHTATTLMTSFGDDFDTSIQVHGKAGIWDSALWWTSAAQCNVQFPFALEGIRQQKLANLVGSHQYRAMLVVWDILRRGKASREYTFRLDSFWSVVRRLRIDGSLLQELCDFETRTTPFQRCLLAARLATTDDESTLSLRVQMNEVLQNPTAEQTFDMLSIGGFFASFGTQWTSQRAILDSWMRLESLPNERSLPSSLPSSVTSGKASSREKPKVQLIWDMS